MSIAFQCPACKTTRNAPGMLAGRRVRCPECDTLVEVTAVNVPALNDQDVETVPLEPVDVESVEPVLLEVVEEAVPLGLTPLSQSSGSPPFPPAPSKVLEEDELPERKKPALVETEMDMTPMVDATFQLLIFFMITAAFALQKSKEIPKPQSKEPSQNVVQQTEDSAAAVVVQIDEHNSYVVIDANGDEEEAPSTYDLHAKLRKAHEGDSEGRVPTKLRVEAHGEALHERVITAIDVGNDVGFAEVELASIEDDA